MKRRGGEGGRRRNGGWRRSGEERLDWEMRDVRRDGLIEAFLIAFTPLHGLLYPRYPVSVFCSGSTSYLALAASASPLLRFLRPFIPSPLCSIFSICFFSLRLPSLPPPSAPPLFSPDRLCPVLRCTGNTCVYYAHCVNFLVNVDA